MGRGGSVCHLGHGNKINGCSDISKLPWHPGQEVFLFIIIWQELSMNIINYIGTKEHEYKT